jgi:hypothetical protein
MSFVAEQLAIRIHRNDPKPFIRIEREQMRVIGDELINTRV